jgi:hypothetical protein
MTKKPTIEEVRIIKRHSKKRALGTGGSKPGKRPNFGWIEYDIVLLKALQIVGRNYSGLKAGTCVACDGNMDEVFPIYQKTRGWDVFREGCPDEEYTEAWEAFCNSVTQRMDKTNRYPAERERLENLSIEQLDEAVELALHFIGRLSKNKFKPNAGDKYSSGRTSSETTKNNEAIRIEGLTMKQRIKLRKMMGFSVSNLHQEKK